MREGESFELQPKKKADRYTVLEVKSDELPAKLQACAALRLTYLVKNDNSFDPVHGSSLLFIFFDSAGMDNYLHGYYYDGEERQ